MANPKILLALNPELNEWLCQHAECEQKPKTVVIRDALKAYRRDLEKEALTLELSRRALSESA